MKKFKGCLLSLATFLICLTNVDAACSAEEQNKLNSLAVNVGANYEVIEKEIEVGENYNFPDGLSEEEFENYVVKRKFFRISITNLTEDLYVVVTDQATKESKTYRYSDSDNGTVYFDEALAVIINNYTIDVYSSSNTGCPDTKLYSLALTTPMYNNYSESVMCNGIENFYLCHPYLSVDVSFDNFESLVEKYKAGNVDDNGEEIKKDEKKKGFKEFLKEHKAIIIVTSVGIIAVGGLVTTIIVKKQRSRIV